MTGFFVGCWWGGVVRFEVLVYCVVGCGIWRGGDGYLENGMEWFVMEGSWNITCQ